MSGTGSTVFNGALQLSGNGLRDITARSVTFAGTTTWTNFARGNAGRFGAGSGAALVNAGLFLDQTSFNSSVNYELGGPAPTFVNAGTFTKTGASTTSIGMAFNNRSTVDVRNGVLSLCCLCQPTSRHRSTDGHW